MSGDREKKKPAGWYSKEQRAARAAAFAERKAAAAVKREEKAKERARVEATYAPIRSAASRRLASLPACAPIDRKLVTAARARTRKLRQKQLLDRVRDVIDVRQVQDEEGAAPTPSPMPPTPEQAAHARYVEEKILDRSPGGNFVLTGTAYRRRPKFEMIEGLGADERRALSRYRTAFDNSEKSETKSALDIRPRGGGGAEAALSRLEDIAFADWELRRFEAGVRPALVPTLRAVALHDHDFKAVAMARFGSREVSRIDTSRRRPVERSTIEPKSGRHRAIIREEFMLAVRQLVAVVKPIEEAERIAAATGEKVPAVITPDPLPGVDPAYLDDHGRMRPFEEVREIIMGRFNPVEAQGVDDEK